MGSLLCAEVKGRKARKREINFILVSKKRPEKEREAGSPQASGQNLAVLVPWHNSCGINNVHMVMHSEVYWLRTIKSRSRRLLRQFLAFVDNLK